LVHPLLVPCIISALSCDSLLVVTQRDARSSRDESHLHEVPKYRSDGLSSVGGIHHRSRDVSENHFPGPDRVRVRVGVRVLNPKKPATEVNSQVDSKSRVYDQRRKVQQQQSRRRGEAQVGD